MYRQNQSVPTIHLRTKIVKGGGWLQSLPPPPPIGYADVSRPVGRFDFALKGGRFFYKSIPKLSSTISPELPIYSIKTRTFFNRNKIFGGQSTPKNIVFATLSAKRRHCWGIGMLPTTPCRGNYTNVGEILMVFLVETGAYRSK